MQEAMGTGMGGRVGGGSMEQVWEATGYDRGGCHLGKPRLSGVKSVGAGGSSVRGADGTTLEIG